MAVRTLRSRKGITIVTQISDAEAARLLLEAAPRLADKSAKFARELSAKFRSYGGFTPEQAVWAHKMVRDAGLMPAGEAPPPQTQAPQEEDRPEPVQLPGALRLYSMFRAAKAAGAELPRVVFSTPAGRPLAVSMATGKSKYPGHLNVTDNGTWHKSVWYGRIGLDGKFFPSGDCDGEVFDMLVALAEKPLEVSNGHTARTGMCGLCQCKLEKPENGVDAACRKAWGL